MQEEPTRQENTLDLYFTTNLSLGLWLFSKKKYSDSQCCWKKYSDFGGGQKKSDSEFLSYNLILNSGKKNSERNKKP
jgi:hypothetical protein